MRRAAGAAAKPDVAIELRGNRPISHVVQTQLAIATCGQANRGAQCCAAGGIPF